MRVGGAAAVGKGRGLLLAALAALSLSGCAGHLPVPGGDEKVNRDYYTCEDDFLGRVDKLQVGMSMEMVLSILGRKQSDLTKLSRQEIMAALYGGTDSGFNGSLADQERARAFLDTLYGYRLSYKNVDHEHGFSSPWRINTTETGYSYTLTLVFQSGHLFEKPALSGGIVNSSSSKTIFDYLNPSTFMHL